MSERVTNWAGNVVFGARRVHRPTRVAQVQDLVVAGGPVRVLGSGHSFNRMADTTGDLVSLADLPRVVEIAPDRTSVRVDGGIRYGELVGHLHAHGLALHNLASLPHISVAGAVATATHGSGVGNGNLATAVSGLELIRGDGEPVSLTRGDRGFAGAVVALGALGVVTALTLDVVPAFRLRQYVYDDLPRAALDEHLPEILAAGYSVSLFTNWRSRDVNHVWLKRHDPMPPAPFFGARPADGPRHPIPGLPADSSTVQLGVPGPWHARLPHFRREFTPSAGDELQSEWFVPRERALEAVEAVERVRAVVAPAVQVTEIRTVAADDLWLSMHHGRDSVALHCTGGSAAAAVRPAVAAVQEQLAPLDPRPHWGKVFTTELVAVRAGYPRFGDFADLVAAHDPAGTFRNPWLDALLEAA